MRYSDNLFQLIQSLNRNEKKHFALYAKRHVIGGKNDYLKLFEMINKQKVYDEGKIKKALGEEVLINNFRVLKNHLYHHLINSLRSYHSQKTKDSVLQNNLQAVEILFNKGLFIQAEKLLNKAKQIACQYERYAKLLDIVGWEKKMIVAKSYANISLLELQKVYKEEREIVEKIGIINTYWYQSHHTFLVLTKKGVRRTKKNKTPLSKKIASEEFSIDAAVPFKAKMFNYHLKGVYFYTEGDLKSSYTYRKKLVELMEKQPIHTQQEPINYLVALQDLMIVCSKLKKYDEFQLLLKQLRTFSIDDKEEQPIAIQVRIFVISYILEMDMFIREGEFEKGASLIGGVEAKLKQFEDKMTTNEKLAMYANIAYLWFGVGKYKLALECLNKLFNDIKADIREDIYADAKVMYLIVHYELGNIDTLSYFVRATHHFYMKKKRMFQFELLVLDFFQKISKVNSKQQLTGSFKAFKKQLKQITKDSLERKALDYFDFISWLESKIEGKTFAEVVRGKLK